MILQRRKKIDFNSYFSYVPQLRHLLARRMNLNVLAFSLINQREKAFFSRSGRRFKRIIVIVDICNEQQFPIYHFCSL